MWYVSVHIENVFIDVTILSNALTLSLSESILNNIMYVIILLFKLML